MRRPLHTRVWFSKPQWYFGIWKPFHTGADEFDWHTVVVGFPFTGMVTVSTRHCPGSRGRRAGCKEHEELWGPLTDWPITNYELEELP